MLEDNCFFYISVPTEAGGYHSNPWVLVIPQLMEQKG